ncbi:MFS transporter [Phenylobacterium sp. J367]|uniref:MFS transporter n=1 Tax=Phenylobacterium sp. J367 TaxID=2898435 RepID=UPI00215116C9|nr:MFS transporter [Phenylobacterium sp. J367]MCR5879291.1 MFS transporter [Phenylobacterium sp. J367]
MTAPISASSATALAPPERWTAVQLLVVGLCFVVNMLDGMDVLILSYIAPTLQTEWAIGPERMGVVFSAGIVGMAIGGIVVAPLADVFGRRLLILASLATSTAAMLASGLVGDIGQLMVLRVFVGIGIGAVLASMAAIIAEYAPDRDRNFAVGLLYAGYPLGAIITGFVSAWAIPAFGWRAVLTGAGVVSLAMFPVLLITLPESLEFLAKRRPRDALARLNRVLRRMGRPPLTALPDVPEAAARQVGGAGPVRRGPDDRDAASLVGDDLWLHVALVRHQLDPEARHAVGPCAEGGGSTPVRCSTLGPSAAPSCWDGWPGASPCRR